MIAEFSKINSERKINSGNNAWTCSARPAKVRRKRSKTHSPRRLGAPKAPCGFWSALSHRLGRPRAASPCAPGPGVGFAFGVDLGDHPDTHACIHMFAEMLRNVAELLRNFCGFFADMLRKFVREFCGFVAEILRVHASRTSPGARTRT